MGSFQTSTFQPNSRLTRSRRAGSLTGAGAVVVAITYSVIQRQARGGGPAFARRSRLRTTPRWASRGLRTRPRGAPAPAMAEFVGGCQRWYSDPDRSGKVADAPR